MDDTQKKAWLIEGWQFAFRLDTVRAAALLALLSFLQAQVLPLFSFAIPPQYFPWVTGLLGLAILLLRLRAQPDALAPEKPAASEASP